MSTSEMGLSWSSGTARNSIQSLQSSSVFLTQSKSLHNKYSTSRPASQSQTQIRKRPVLSARISGMRFPGWKEPKPLRTPRPSSMYQDSEVDKIPMKKKRTRSTNSRLSTLTDSTIAGSRASTVQSTSTSTKSSDSDVSNLIERLSKPTLSSKTKATNHKTREAAVDMNWYSWSKMKVYQDYQRVIYGNNGTMRRSAKGKERK